MKNFRKIWYNLIATLFLILPVLVFAQEVTDGTTQTSDGAIKTTIKIPNPLKSGNGDLMALVIQIINNIVLPVGTVLCVLYIIYAGFKFVQAQGKPADVTKARDSLLWALVGTGILLGAAGISKVLQTTVSNITSY